MRRAAFLALTWAIGGGASAAGREGKRETMFAGLTGMARGALRSSAWRLAAAALTLAPATAHHLEDYDTKIRLQAGLPASWFACNTASDCELTQVPCQSDLAVSARHAEEAHAALVKTFWFCLGTDEHDTEAECKARQCVTKSKKND